MLDVETKECDTKEQQQIDGRTRNWAAAGGL